MSADTQNGASGVGDTRRAVAPAWKTLGVGAVSGFTSCVLLQPIDFLKTRLQQEKSTQTQMSRTNRLLASVRSVVAQHGWTGLWRGTLPTVVRNVPGVAAYFYTVNEIRWLVAAGQVPWLSVPPLKQGTSTLARLSPMGNLLTGAVARVGIGFILNPITIVKARFESSHYAHDSYPTISKSLRSIYRESGPSGFFRGFSATALRDAPYAGLYLVVYERSKVALSELSARVQSVPSVIAATIATLLTHPFDIIKTRMQTTPKEMLHDMSPTFMSTVRHILKSDGIGTFADGVWLRCARKGASSAIAWSIFEIGNRWATDSVYK